VVTEATVATDRTAAVARVVARPTAVAVATAAPVRQGVAAPARGAVARTARRTAATGAGATNGTADRVATALAVARTARCVPSVRGTRTALLTPRSPRASTHASSARTPELACVASA